MKRLGKKIVIVTEGLQDAQEWTVEKLGLSSFIDYPATTNHFKVQNQRNGWAILDSPEDIGISPSEIAYIGDNGHREMRPAIAEDIFSFQLPSHIPHPSIPP
ncbi:hypothetical protein GGS21DRAFT_532817, partial [Xylaria nigripes]